jgi:hypothetical protein
VAPLCSALGSNSIMRLVREPEKEFKLVHYSMLPVATLVIAISSWLWLIEPDESFSPHVNLIWLVGVAVLTYETGYKKCLPSVSKTYFFVVFVIPLLIALGGVAGGYIFNVT